jgi:hypothetical protein
VPILAIAVSQAGVAATTHTRSGSAPGSTRAAPAATAPVLQAIKLEPLTMGDCTGILGKKIVGPDGKELGLVTDILLDARARPRAAVIDFGGFLGVGSRKIAIDWRLFKLAPGQPDWKISLHLDRRDIQAAPKYKPDAASDEIVALPPIATPSPDK